MRFVLSPTEFDCHSISGNPAQHTLKVARVVGALTRFTRREFCCPAGHSHDVLSLSFRRNAAVAGGSML